MSRLLTEVRWRAKKAARVTMALLSWTSGALFFRRRFAKSPHVRVLMYHRFREDPRDPFSVSPAEFDRQMRWLSEHRLAVSAEDFAEFLLGRRELADGSVVVSVDDGYRDFLTEALPIMRRHGIPGICFVPVAEIAGDGDTGTPERLTWRDLDTLIAAGIAVGSHSFEHRSLGSLSRGEAYAQAHRSRLELERHLGRRVVAFAYPYGTRADYNDTTRTVLEEAGYVHAFVTQHGAVTRRADPLEIPRVKIEGGEGLWMFRLIVRGGLDAWSWIDRSLWWLQQGGDRRAVAHG